MLKKECDLSWKSLGKVFYGPTRNEIIFKKSRRSIYASMDIKKGDKFTEKNIKVIRPANCLHPKYFEKILGKKSRKFISFGTPLKKIFIKN